MTPRKTIFILCVLLLVFLILALRSDMFETKTVIISRDGIEYKKIKQIAHWGRLWKYITEGLPEEAEGFIEGVKEKFAGEEEEKGTIDVSYPEDVVGGKYDKSNK